MAEPQPQVTKLSLRKKTAVLFVEFANGESYELPLEYLRVHSPSAEVQGHGAGEGRLIAGKREVAIERIEPVGRYAVRLHFDDGHNTGLFSWRVLQRLGRDRETLWARYLERLNETGESREPNDGPVPLHSIVGTYKPKPLADGGPATEPPTTTQ